VSECNGRNDEIWRFLYADVNHRPNHWPYARMTYLLHFRRPERGERLKQWITGRFVYGEFVWPKLVFKLKIAVNCWLRLAQLSTVARSIIRIYQFGAASCCHKVQ
jgi:hypothetical protein